MLRGAIEVGAVIPCPHRGEPIVVHDALGPEDLSATFMDPAVACNAECGALWDVEWEAMRTMPGRWSASVTGLTPSVLDTLTTDKEG